MSEFRNAVLGIHGDGNAVGDNNHITVIKKEEHHFHHRSGSNEEDADVIWGVAVAVLLAILVSCYYFSRSADDIYTALEAIGWGEALAALAATVAYGRRAAYGVAVKSAAIAI